jgi:hypothetical protein
MKKVLLIGMVNWFSTLVTAIKKLVPDLIVTSNFEEVQALAKNGELGKLCVIISGYNYSGSPTNCIEGHEVAEKLHDINPNIPIMIINGAKTELSEETGLLEQVSKNSENEIYVDNSEELVRSKFFSGELFQEFFI